MSEILFQYHKVNPTTWVYLSSLLTIGLFFKFSRLLSVRNLDLIGLIMLAPGLLMVEYGLAKASIDLESAAGIEQAGYIWLFVMSGLFMVRLLLDPLMVRRPLLEPNLSVGGMTFIGTSLLGLLDGQRHQQQAHGRRPGRRQKGPAGDAACNRLRPRTRAWPSTARAIRCCTCCRSFPRKCCSSRDRPAADAARARRAPRRGADGHGPHDGHLGAHGRGDRHGGDRLSAFRQHQDRHRRRHAVSDAALHGPNDRPRRSRAAGRAADLGDRSLSPAAGGRRLDGAGDRRELLPGVPAAAVAQLLLASRAAAVFGRRGGDDLGDGGLAGLHLARSAIVPGAVAADVQLAIACRRRPKAFGASA